MSLSIEYTPAQQTDERQLPVAVGQALVATSLAAPGEPPHECAASPFIAGELRRRGVPTLRGDIASGFGDLVAATAGGAGPVGWAVAVHGTDDRLRHTVQEVRKAWLAAAGPRTVLLASPRSFCAGVERAIKIVEVVLERATGPVFVRKEIVHNKHVVADLERRGATFVDTLDAVPDGATVVFSAHGVSPQVRLEAARRGLSVIDGTCPLVSKVHAEARRHASRGDLIVLIGHHEHEEVEGVMGEAPESIVLIESPADVATLDLQPNTHVSYLTQTTLAADETADVVSALRDRFPDLRGPESEDICYATTNRQEAVRVVARRSDLVLVVGSPNSSNSVRLVELAGRLGTAAHLIDDTSDIRPEWLVDVRTVGLSAGASAPPQLVDQVVRALGGLGPVDVQVYETAVETIEFGLPAAVRPTTTDPTQGSRSSK